MRCRLAFTVVFGCAMTLCVGGYQFGRSNHTVYLLDALHRLHPELLANDWFTTHTLQYHAAFGGVTRVLMRWGIVRPAFLVGYLLLVVLFHVTWLRLTLRLGGSIQTYLLAVLLYYVSAGGLALGVYEFFQDAAMLPSNIANVALLCGILAWAEDRPTAAGARMGLAGLMHLNAAVVVVGLWPALLLWEYTRPSPGVSGPLSRPGREEARSSRIAPFVIGTLLALGLSLVNILPAAHAALEPRARLPLRDFVNLYVHLRHPHHYDPAAWPLALWLCFLWPIPLAIIGFRQRATDPSMQLVRTRVGRVFALFCGLLVVALLGAGVWYVSETLIQMSLYRFSIYVKLIAVTMAACVVGDAARERRLFTAVAMAVIAAAVGTVAVAHAHPGAAASALVLPRTAMILLLAGILAVPVGVLWSSPRAQPAAAVGGSVILIALLFTGWDRWLGINAVPTDSPSYLALCEWVRDPAHIPVDAILLVPPEEQSMRLEGRRAIVVDFKGVPQLSSELIEWRDRMRSVLDLPDLMTLPKRFDRTLAAAGERYESLPPAYLFQVAQKYGARYVVVDHPLPGEDRRRVYPANENGPWLLYDLTR